jgi:hypothetical protein
MTLEQFEQGRKLYLLIESLQKNVKNVDSWIADDYEMGFHRYPDIWAEYLNKVKTRMNEDIEKYTKEFEAL